MICPYCKSINTKCLDSRPRNKYRMRRYKCTDCARRFSTHEIVVEDSRRGRKDEGNCLKIYLDNGNSYTTWRLSRD